MEDPSVWRYTCSFSTKSMKAVLSTSMGWPCRSYNASTKWKKLLFRRLLGGCFSKCALPNPTLLSKSYSLQWETWNLLENGSLNTCGGCPYYRLSSPVRSPVIKTKNSVFSFTFLPNKFHSSYRMHFFNINLSQENSYHSVRISHDNQNRNDNMNEKILTSPLGPKMWAASNS